MKKAIVVPMAAAVFALGATACSPQQTPEEELMADMEAEWNERYPSAGQEAPSGKSRVGAGETIEIEGWSYNPSDAELRLTDVWTSDECYLGEGNYSSVDPEPTEDKTYVHILGEFEVFPGDGNGRETLSPVSLVDAEGFTQTPELQLHCAEYDDKHSSWTTTVDAGQKARVYYVGLVPRDTQHLLFEGYEVEISE